MRPYDIEDIPSYEWIMTNRPVVSVPVYVLRPTQELVRIDRLLAIARGEPREGPDPYPHTVFVDGLYWIHNGNTAYAAAVVRGDTQMLVRVAYVNHWSRL